MMYVYTYTHTHTHTRLYIDTMQEEMEELMQNKEFLQSVLSTLPGVNPEQALLNLREMTEASTSASSEQPQQEEEKKEKKEEEMEEGKVSSLTGCIIQP